MNPREPAATVVLAEDSLVIRAVVRRHLEQQGYIVIEAPDGPSALLACRESQPDAVLLDIEMPGLDGLQVLAEIKDTPELDGVPVVFLTGRATTDDVVTGLRLGAHDYLKKPFEPAELMARVGAAVRVKRLQDELRQRNIELDAISRTDALTGLNNRRHATEHLVGYASSSRRHGRPVSVLIFDIDRFKAINDRYGHAGGDAVLVQFSQRLRPLMRAEDVAARWGGEEFLVLLPDTDSDAAVAVGERIVAAISSQLFDVGESEPCQVTVSGGCVTGKGEDPDELLRRADDALYHAKNSGRNQLMLGH